MSRPDLTKRAKRDLHEIWTYIRERNPSAADRVAEDMLDKSRFYADFPGMGRPRREFSAARLVRSFQRYSYLVFYRRTRDGIEVLRIIHAVRDIQTAWNQP